MKLYVIIFLVHGIPGKVLIFPVSLTDKHRHSLLPFPPDGYLRTISGLGKWLFTVGYMGIDGYRVCITNTLNATPLFSSKKNSVYRAVPLFSFP